MPMVHAILMAGGSGTRFWPLSRSKKAKQFLSIIGETTLLEDALTRVKTVVPAQNTWMVANINQKPFLEAYVGPYPTDQILYEPQSRNTMACIGWAALEVLKKDPDAIMVVLPADAYIDSTSAFQQVVEAAIQLVTKQDVLVTIGIKPTFPHTGYGYIEISGAHLKQKLPAFPIKLFREKPNYETAEQYVNTKRFFWNSGMFVWKAKHILSLLEHFHPRDFECLGKVAALSFQEQANQSAKFKRLYAQITSLSIDFAVMEKAVSQTMMIPATFRWSDIGNWSALGDFWPQDRFGNAYRGPKQLLALDSHDNVVFSDKPLVSLVDVDHLIVVDTPDALMILPKSSDQRIRDLYQKLPPHFQ